MEAQYVLIFIGVISITTIILITQDAKRKKIIKNENKNLDSSNLQIPPIASQTSENILNKSETNINVKKDLSVKRRNLEYTSLEQYLKGHGIAYIDNRPKGGALWVLDIYDNFKNIKLELLKKGIDFRIAEHGGRASNYKKAWYTKNVDDQKYQNVQIKWLIPDEDYSTSKINLSIPIKKTENFNYEHTNKERQEEIKSGKEAISEKGWEEFKEFAKSREEKMDDFHTAHTCRNCMLQRAEDCVGAKQICEFFKYAPRLDR
ncbi:MAG: hypothetical protein WCL51_01305 [Bacteroidota bacterium]